VASSFVAGVGASACADVVRIIVPYVACAAGNDWIECMI
jgi:hypothetical protein